MSVKWGIIGCGDVVVRKSGLAFSEAKNSEIVAVMKRDPEKAKQFAQEHGVRKYYSDVDALLQDEEIDAVYIATPPYVHAEHTIKAAKHGKHVLCEKPMAMSVKECQEMIKACEENEVQLMIAYYRRWYPVAQKMKELLREGKIGQPIFARATILSMYEPQASNWRIDPRIAGGGFLTDVGSHFIDLLIYLIGEAKEVGAVVDTIYLDIEADDSSSLIMRFVTGAQTTMHVVASFYWNISARTNEFEISGTEGKIFATDVETGDLKLFRDGENKEYQLPPPPLTLTRVSLVEDFVRSIITGKKNSVPGEEGLKTAKIIEAAYQSSKRREIVKIS